MFWNKNDTKTGINGLKYSSVSIRVKKPRGPVQGKAEKGRAKA